MQKHEIMTALTNSGWTVDRWGHLQKDICRDGVTTKRYRVALRPRVARLEVLVENNDAAKSKSWMMLHSDYYGNIRVNDKGKLVIGKIAIRLEKR